MKSTLERRYRLLLYAYPHEYRRSRGDEIVATLLDCARPGQRLPGLAESADLLGHAIRRRCGFAATADFHTAVTMAAPWALAVAAGIAGFVWWQVEPAIPTTGPLIYAAWLVAALFPARQLIGIAILTTLCAPLLAVAVPAQRPPVWIIMSLTGLGCIAFAGLRHTTMELRLNMIAAAAAIIIGCKAITPRVDGYYQPVIARVGAVIAVGVLATAVIAISRRLQGRSPRVPIIAGLLLALPATWLGPIDAIAWHLPLDIVTAARFGRLAHVILATCVVVAVLAWMSSTEKPDDHLATRRLSGIAVGCAVGNAGFVYLMLGPAAWPGPAIAATAVAGLISLLLGARPAPMALASSAGAIFTAALAIGIYSNDWSLTWNDPMRTVVLASMLTMVPCSFAAYSVARFGLRSTRHALTLTVALGWIGYLTLPALIAWGPLLWAIVLTVLVAAVHRATRALLRRRAAP
jgi:uncharacterized membrane protein YjjB (DUF3815 family)